ncbi:MAG: hypothetical protein ABI411_09785 [Tahibacter sp.]
MVDRHPGARGYPLASTRSKAVAQADFQHWLPVPGCSMVRARQRSADMQEEWLEQARHIETLVPAIYACISGKAGAARDWSRFRYLQRPDALSLRNLLHDDGRIEAQVFGVEAYIANVEPFFAQNDFFEFETAQRIERFGQIAHVWSSYEARPSPGSPTLLKRGANSIQLHNDGARWWVVSTIWDNEREGLRFDLF